MKTKTNIHYEIESKPRGAEDVYYDAMGVPYPEHKYRTALGYLRYVHHDKEFRAVRVTIKHEVLED